MKNFNANEAKKIVSTLNNDELHNILTDIKRKAEEGETVLHIYDTLRQSTTDELKKRGFEVVHRPSIAIQKDNLYYSVYWR